MRVDLEVVLAAAYAALLIGISKGLAALGARVVGTNDGADAARSWPRCDALRLYRTVAAVVAALAAVFLGIAVVRHHDAAEIAVIGVSALGGVKAIGVRPRRLDGAGISRYRS